MTYFHKINTRLGVFSFEWVNYSEHKKDWWIAGIFDEPKLASKVYRCNPHSGKYNFHGATPLKGLMYHLEDLKNNNLLV